RHGPGPSRCEPRRGKLSDAPRPLVKGCGSEAAGGFARTFAAPRCGTSSTAKTQRTQSAQRTNFALSLFLCVLCVETQSPDYPLLISFGAAQHRLLQLHDPLRFLRRFRIV